MVELAIEHANYFRTFIGHNGVELFVPKHWHGHPAGIFFVRCHIDLPHGLGVVYGISALGDCPAVLVWHSCVNYGNGDQIR